MNHEVSHGDGICLYWPRPNLFSGPFDDEAMRDRLARALRSDARYAQFGWLRPTGDRLGCPSSAIREHEWPLVWRDEHTRLIVAGTRAARGAALDYLDAAIEAMLGGATDWVLSHSASVLVILGSGWHWWIDPAGPKTDEGYSSGGYWRKRDDGAHEAEWRVRLLGLEPTDETGTKPES